MIQLSKNRAKAEKFLFVQECSDFLMATTDRSVKKFDITVVGLGWMVAMLFASSAHGQTERECLSAGKIAESSAVLMQEGHTEEYVISILTDPQYDDPKIPKARRKVIAANQVDIARYVFTLRHSPTTARATVYAKCMAGGLGYIDWSKHRAAVRAK
jgi:hypothetical protein